MRRGYCVIKALGTGIEGGKVEGEIMVLYINIKYIHIYKYIINLCFIFSFLMTLDTEILLEWVKLLIYIRFSVYLIYNKNKIYLVAETGLGLSLNGN